jgi:hypothetical protein
MKEELLFKLLSIIERYEHKFIDREYLCNSLDSILELSDESNLRNLVKESLYLIDNTIHITNSNEIEPKIIEIIRKLKIELNILFPHKIFFIQNETACYPINTLLNLLCSMGGQVVKSKIIDQHFGELEFQILLKNFEASELANGVNGIFTNEMDDFFCDCHWSVVKVIKNLHHEQPS